MGWYILDPKWKFSHRGSWVHWNAVSRGNSKLLGKADLQHSGNIFLQYVGRRVDYLSRKGEFLREYILRSIFRTQKDTDKDSKAYWNARWFINLKHDRILPESRAQLVYEVEKLMAQYDCMTILELGCGAEVPLRQMQHAAHLDYSLEALRRSRLDAFIYADVTKNIPLPDKSFDASFSSNLLLHIKDENVVKACAEISRVTKKLVILNESDKRDLEGEFVGLMVVRL